MYPGFKKAYFAPATMTNRDCYCDCNCDYL